MAGDVCVGCVRAAASVCQQSATGVKQIFVTVTVRSSIGGFMLPRSTVMALKSAQF